MAVMARYPDKYFDLAVVDPPYGDGCSQSLNVERERADSPAWNRFGERFDRYKHTEAELCKSGGGWHGKQKYHLGTQNRKCGEVVSPGQAGDGRTVSTHQKNYFVGCSAGAEIF